MSKEKLTDEQIMKAYEHCCLGGSCVGCPLEDELGVEQCLQMRRNILNLINRLKEEKEDLRLDKWELMNTISEKDNRIALLEDNNAELKAENERLQDKDSVVLSKEEYDTLRAENDKYVKDCIDYLATINKLENKVWEVEQQSSKETAEKFYEFAKAWFGDDEQNDYFVEVKNFAKQLGVEIKDV